MQVIKSLEKLPFFSGDTAVAIGNFDGLHLGHQKILQVLIQRSKTDSLFPVVLTFNPHPENILRAQKIKRLHTLHQRLQEIGKYEISCTVILTFNKAFANMTAEDFISDIICRKLKAKAVIVGENFHFGKGREGDVFKLRQMASTFHYTVQSIPPVVKQGHVVSSSLIREFLQRGDVEMANTLIGRPYAIEGTVIKGKSRGEDIGFPTANIRTWNDIVPPGVFISQVGIQSQKWPSVTHSGRKPTFNENDQTVESYIFGFTDNLYGQKIHVYFLKRIRDEKKFKTPRELSLQIQKDIESAESYFQEQLEHSPYSKSSG